MKENTPLTLLVLRSFVQETSFIKRGRDHKDTFVNGYVKSLTYLGANPRRGTTRLTGELLLLLDSLTGLDGSCRKQSSRFESYCIVQEQTRPVRSRFAIPNREPRDMILYKSIISPRRIRRRSYSASLFKQKRPELPRSIHFIASRIRKNLIFLQLP